MNNCRIGMTDDFKFPCSLVPSSYSDTPGTSVNKKCIIRNEKYAHFVCCVALDYYYNAARCQQFLQCNFQYIHNY